MAIERILPYQITNDSGNLRYVLPTTEQVLFTELQLAYLHNLRADLLANKQHLLVDPTQVSQLQNEAELAGGIELLTNLLEIQVVIDTEAQEVDLGIDGESSDTDEEEPY